MDTEQAPEGAQPAPSVTSDPPVIHLKEVAPGVFEIPPDTPPELLERLRTNLPGLFPEGAGGVVGPFRVLIDNNTDEIPEHHKKPFDPTE